MDDGTCDNLIGHRAEVDGIREAPYQGAAYFTVDAGIRLRGLEDAAERRF